MEELSSAALRDCPGEEELVAVLGKERRFILQRGEKINNKNVLNKMPAGLSVQAPFFCHIPVGATSSHSHPRVSEEKKNQPDLTDLLNKLQRN